LKAHRPCVSLTEGNAEATVERVPRAGKVTVAWVGDIPTERVRQIL